MVCSWAKCISCSNINQAINHIIRELISDGNRRINIPNDTKNGSVIHSNHFELFYFLSNAEILNSK